MKKILMIFGTRPEGIKMAPLYHVLKKHYDIKICVTAQHREMLDQVMSIFKIVPDYDLNLMKPNQQLSELNSEILLKLRPVFDDFNPDLVLVHGDTTSAMASSVFSFYNQIPVGHVEAGLRTCDIYSPYPEEFNRQAISRIAKFHFAPTKLSKKNLIKENIIEDDIYITGNTVIDAMMSILPIAREEGFTSNLLDRMPFLDLDKEEMPKIILVTGHRRENFGKGFQVICDSLYEIARENKDVHLIYPVHLNPNVLIPVKKILSGLDNVHLIDPLNYPEFLKLMDLSYIVLTDSGGIQEEAPSLGKPVLVMRDNTERPEAVEANTVKLVGASKKNIVSSVNHLLNNKEKYEEMSTSRNPYGDGTASNKILKILTKNL